MKDETFSLCNSCKFSAINKCTMYRNNPDAQVTDCGRFEVNPEKATFQQAVLDVLNHK